MATKNFSDLKSGDTIYEVHFNLCTIHDGSTWDDDYSESFEPDVQIIPHTFKKLYKNMPQSEWAIDMEAINDWDKSGIIFGTDNPDFPNSPYINKENYISMWFSDKTTMLQWILTKQTEEINELKKKIDKINKGVKKATETFV